MKVRCMDREFNSTPFGSYSIDSTCDNLIY